MLTKKQLEIILSKLRIPENPKEKLEQYSIPSALAAEILNFAKMSGDIEGKAVGDFGCGSGRLAIGAKMLGAAKVVGVDIDEDSVKIAEENAEANEVDVEFVQQDISEFVGEFDTIVQNPPFGMRGEKHSDRLFLQKALECVKIGGRVYTLHRGGYQKTREFIERFVEQNGGEVKGVKEMDFDIPYMFKFHKKPKVSYKVDLFVIERVK